MGHEVSKGMCFSPDRIISAPLVNAFEEEKWQLKQKESDPSDSFCPQSSLPEKKSKITVQSHPVVKPQFQARTFLLACSVTKSGSSIYPARLFCPCMPTCPAPDVR